MPAWCHRVPTASPSPAMGAGARSWERSGQDVLDWYACGPSGSQGHASAHAGPLVPCVLDRSLLDAHHFRQRTPGPVTLGQERESHLDPPGLLRAEVGPTASLRTGPRDRRAENRHARQRRHAQGQPPTLTCPLPRPFIADESRSTGHLRPFIGRRSLSFVDSQPFIDDDLRSTGHVPALDGR